MPLLCPGTTLVGFRKGAAPLPPKAGAEVVQPQQARRGLVSLVKALRLLQRAQGRAPVGGNRQRAPPPFR